MTSQEITDLFERAKKHVLEHHCSAKPYENWERLHGLVGQYEPKKILEIGTGMGFTAAILADSSSGAEIHTIERNHDHVLVAKVFLTSYKNVEFIEGIAEEVLPTLSEQYDLIFFDAFGIHYEFLPQYHRLLQKGGLAVIANNHLLSKTSDRFFAELSNRDLWKIVEKFGDTTVAMRV